MENNTSPIKAIKEKCLDCMCDSYTNIKNCPSTKCPLYPFRFGKNPFTNRRKLTDEEKQAAAERLKKAREAKNV